MVLKLQAIFAIIYYIINIIKHHGWTCFCLFRYIIICDVCQGFDRILHSVGKMLSNSALLAQDESLSSQTSSLFDVCTHNALTCHFSRHTHIFDIYLTLIYFFTILSFLIDFSINDDWFMKWLSVLYVLNEGQRLGLNI